MDSTMALLEEIASLPPLQDHGVSGLKTQTEHVRRHIGSGLVNHAHHADGHSAFSDLQTVGASRTLSISPMGSGSATTCRSPPPSDESDPRQKKPVQKALEASVSFAVFHIHGIGRENPVRVTLQSSAAARMP